MRPSFGHTCSAVAYISYAALLILPCVLLSIPDAISSCERGKLLV
jgi:hypothetical protein